MTKLKILHYTFGLPPYATGGLPKYVMDLAEQQKLLNNEVAFLLPKQTFFKQYKIIKKMDNIFYIYSPIPVPLVFGVKDPDKYLIKCDTKQIQIFLDNYQPDIIHIHSLMGLPIEFVKIAKKKNIRIIYTTHDYYGLCLKCTFINEKGHICNEKDINKCSICNYSNGINYRKAKMINSIIYQKIKKNIFVRVLKQFIKKKNIQKGFDCNHEIFNVPNELSYSYKELYKYYSDMFSLIDEFHYNSELTKLIYQKYLGNTKGEVIPITLNHIQNNVHTRKKHVKDYIAFGFIGRNEPYKGLNILYNALNELDKRNINFACYLYGDDFHEYDGRCKNKIKNMGMYDSRELFQVFDSIDVLIVPSICYETFGFVVLEALSYGVPVLVSTNVGSKFLLKNNPQNIFNVDSDDLLRKLLDICKGNMKKYEINDIDGYFDMENHAKKVIEFYREE